MTYVLLLLPGFIRRQLSLFLSVFDLVALIEVSVEHVLSWDHG